MQMPNTMIRLDFHKCRPGLCNAGTCAAVSSCPHNLITQEELYSFPMANPSACKGCAKCINACPLKAISLS